MAHMSVLGIDMAKQIFLIVGMNDTGNVMLRQRCPQSAVIALDRPDASPDDRKGGL